MNTKKSDNITKMETPLDSYEKISKQEMSELRKMSAKKSLLLGIELSEPLK